MQQFTELRHLNLSACHINYNQIADVADGLRMCTALTHIDLSYNRLGTFGAEEGIQRLIKSLCVFPLLVDLKLGSIQMNDEDAHFFARHLPQYPALTRLHIDISGNEFQDDGTRALARVLPQCQELLHLDMGGNYCPRAAQELVDACMRMADQKGRFKLILSNCDILPGTDDQLRAQRRGTKLELILDPTDW